MIHTCNQHGFTIEVNDEYQAVPQKNYIKMGMTKDAIEQTLFIFILHQNDNFDTFSITKDAKFKNDEIALNEGVKLNITILKESGAIICEEKSATLPSGRKIKIVLSEINGMKFQSIFTSIRGMLICLGMEHNPDLKSRNINILKVIDSIKLI